MCFGFYFFLQLATVFHFCIPHSFVFPTLGFTWRNYFNADNHLWFTSQLEISRRVATIRFALAAKRVSKTFSSCRLSPRHMFHPLCCSWIRSPPTQQPTTPEVILHRSGKCEAVACAAQGRGQSEQSVGGKWGIRLNEKLCPLKLASFVARCSGLEEEDKEKKDLASGCTASGH